jgi:hypothetical protein
MAKLLRLFPELKKTIPFEAGDVKRQSAINPRILATWRSYAGENDKEG